MTALLEATGVVKRFGNTVALDGFDLAVEAGEIAGLVGHNGAGKSTFARVTAGLVTPDAGTVRVDGMNASRAADRVRPTLALYIGGMGARGVNFHHEVFARMGYEAQARTIQDFYLAGDKKSAIAAVPTAMVEDVALIGPWAKIADEIQRWQQTVITTFLISCDLRLLEKVTDLVG